MIKEAIYQLVNKEDLSYETAEQVMDEIMSGQASQMHMSAYLTALRMKGETVDEITASAAGMRKAGLKLKHDMEVLEIVGTGGDEASSFNISTTAGFVIAAAGVTVAKHGNRSVSSKSGAADVLEALGATITNPPEKTVSIMKDTNFCFMFAQYYHTAMKYVGPVRKELGIRTIFNILGPLTNPAEASMELMGVYEEALVEPLARVLSRLGVKRGIVVYGQDCEDEISACAPTTCCEIRDGEFISYTLTPEQFGFERATRDDLVGGDPAENAKITRAILAGEEKGPKRTSVILNAAAGIYIGRGDVTMEDAVKVAEDMIDSGKAFAAMEKYIALTNEE